MIREFGKPTGFIARRGNTMVEFAIVTPVAFLMLFGMIIGGIGVYRYQQVAYIAREASRWASVRGNEYASETGNAAADSAAIYNQVIVPRATGLDLTKLTWSVRWPTGKNQYAKDSVRISYNWIPQLYLSAKTMTSTSVSVISF